MIFKEIIIQGFLSYYKKERILLSEGTTIFLGQNNTGKSKLFDSFNWVLFNKIYITEKEAWIENEQEISKLVLNKRLEKEAIENETGKISSKVCLYFEDEDGTDFICERSYVYRMSEKGFVFIGSDLILSEINSFDGNVIRSYTAQDAQNQIYDYMPRKLSKYFLFQGESVSEIMSLHKKSHFKYAINELARLDLYQTATTNANTVVNRFRRKIEEELKKDNATKVEQEKLSEDIEKYETDIAEYKEKSDQAEEEQSKLQIEIENIKIRLAEFEGFEDIIEKRDIKKAELTKKTNQLKNYPEKEWRRELSEKWSFYRVKDKISQFGDFYKELSNRGEVPAPISQKILKESIKNKICSLCGHEIMSESKEYHTVNDKILEKDIDSLGNNLRTIFHYFESYENQIESIPKDIEADQREKEKIELAKKVLKDEIKSLENDIKKFEISEESEKQKEIFQKLKKDLFRLEGREKDCATEIGNCKTRIELCDMYLKQSNQKLLSIASSSDNEELRKKHCLADKVFSTMRDLEDKIKTTIYDDIQKRADEYFQEMTKENRSLGGHIFLDKEHSEVYTVDENDCRIMNINQANRVSIQLSFIAGILTVASNQIGVNFPFIADAPISALGGDNKLPAIKSLINAFEQSVIILKDDYSSDDDATMDPVRQLIHSSPYIEKAYLIQLSNEEKSIDQYTVITALKGGE